MSDASIALNRFGLGGRRDAAPPADPRRALIDQMARFAVRPAPIAALSPVSAIATQIADYREELRVARREERRPQPGGPDAATPAQADPLQVVRRAGRQGITAHYIAAVGARAQVAVASDTPFVERLVHFWANHFAVSVEKFELQGLAGSLEADAVRPHVLGRFRDMLHAVERHPAMLLYLDQAQSIGPGSFVGQRAAARAAPRQVGLNENLAREILELHTLGVRTGYGQTDVTELARALTGWSVGGLAQGPAARFAGLVGRPGAFVFAERLHEPGRRTILGKTYAEGGERQAAAVLDDLAVHPATARHVATKLARHFGGDDPPAPLVARLEAAFLRSGGDLPTVYRALIDAPEVWVAAPVKFRTPWEWAIAAMRALDTREIPGEAVLGLTNQLGQPVWRPGSPAGYDDIAASWAGPDAVMRRVEAAERLAARARTPIDARAAAATLFPGALSATTAQAIARAESSAQAVALMLVSPEFMRR